jgi:hypothetical protein
MRSGFLGMIAIATVAAGLYAAAAFDAADTGARAVSAEVVGDSAAYLALQANGNSPHRGFVSQLSTGKVSVAFGSGNAAGTGINAGSVYYFDDLLNLTNQGTTSVKVQVQATSTTGSLLVCTATSTATMTNACYAATHPTTPVTLAVGAKLYVGLSTDATSLASGQQVAGTLKIVATR